MVILIYGVKKKAEYTEKILGDIVKRDYPEQYKIINSWHP